MHTSQKTLTEQAQGPASSITHGDNEVRLYMQERTKGKTQLVAAARAGLSPRTACKYEHAGRLPSQLKRPHNWSMRKNPFAEDWPWVVAQLEHDSALQGTTLFALLCERHPGRYQSTQVRTLQRSIARWRALQGPEQDVIFEQRHTPAERGQSDFTHMEDLGVTLAGQPFAHLIFHFVLTYSNQEAIHICFSESFEALAEGLEHVCGRSGATSVCRASAQREVGQEEGARPCPPGQASFRSVS